jgi:hypothetical protein
MKTFLGIRIEEYSCTDLGFLLPYLRKRYRRRGKLH